MDHDYKDSTIPKHLLAAADGFLIVYSVDDWASYQLVDLIRKEIKNNCEKKDVVVVVLGTKVDLTNSRQVQSVQALQWANNEKVRLCEVKMATKYIYTFDNCIISDKSTYYYDKNSSAWTFLSY